MTENKRFWILNTLTKYSGIKDKDKLLTFDEVVDLLNTLYEENKELKEDNKQLKQKNKKLQGEYDYLLWLYNGLGCEYDWLKEENEQLKKKNKKSYYTL